jgi:uncharacterized protein (DUF2141 family)
MKPIYKNLLIGAIIYLISISCARQTTPEGGPKDSAKPELIQATPSHNQKNYKGKNIELIFSEDIKLKDAKEEILITPSIGKETKFVAEGKKVTITPEIQFADTTTYNIMFRESIQDVTESNPTEELYLAFSTGPTIDSLSLSGFITDAKTEMPPEKITVALYQSDTFKIFEHKPLYFTKTDKTGKYKINNLKKGNYFIYAFDDKNKNLKVESTSERYGFKAKPIELKRNRDSMNITIFNLDSRPIKLNSARSNIKTTTLRFNKNVTEYTIESPNNELMNTFGDNQTEIVLYYNDANPIKDSIKIRVTAKDSLFQKYDSSIYIKQGEAKSIKTTFSLSVDQPLINYETGLVTIKAKSNIPINDFNLDSTFISIDSIRKINIGKESITQDRTTKRFKIETKIDTSLFSPNQKQNTENKTSKNIPKKELQLILGKGFAVSVYSDSSKKQKVELPAKKALATGTLTIEIDSSEPNYIVELLDNSGKVIQKVDNKKNHTFKNISGEYKVRTTIDENRNGKWDTGNIINKKEPERIVYYRSPEGKYNIPIRENWEVGPIKIKF